MKLDGMLLVGEHMVLHLPQEGGFGVTFNDITKDAAFYTTSSRFVAWLGVFSQERQGLWLTKDDLKGLIIMVVITVRAPPWRSEKKRGKKGSTGGEDSVGNNHTSLYLHIPPISHCIH